MWTSTDIQGFNMEYLLWISGQYTNGQSKSRWWTFCQNGGGDCHLIPVYLNGVCWWQRISPMHAIKITIVDLWRLTWILYMHSSNQSSLRSEDHVDMDRDYLSSRHQNFAIDSHDPGSRTTGGYENGAVWVIPWLYRADISYYSMVYYLLASKFRSWFHFLYILGWLLL